MIKLQRRAFLHMARGAAALPVVSQIVMAENQSTPSRSEPRQRPLAERLAAYAHDLRYDDLDAATVERVKVHVIDTIGCGIGAFQERAVHICRDLALAVAGNATIVGTQRRTTPDLASFANGAAFRYLDFNDTYVGRIAVHPSDQIAACLAVAEAERASIQDLITAIAVAYEVNCRLVDSLDAANRGWDPPVFSLPAVALAAGKLMKLDHERLTQAVNLAINDHIPMAQTRVSAPADIDVDVFGRRGMPFRIHQCSLKAYPAVIYTQTAIAAGIEVAKELGSLDRIAAIEIATTQRGYERTGSEPEKWAPQTRDTADHSLPYITARAMFDGDITNESFAPHMYRDAHILAFMQKIKVREDSKLTARVGAAVPTRVTAILADGQRISREVDYAPGFAERPMTRDDVERKFRGNVGKRWPKPQTDAVLQRLWALDGTNDLSALLGELALPT